MQAFAEAGTVNQNYANILLMLLRLRQACDHPLLVKEYDLDSVGNVSVEMAKRLPRDMLTDLLSRLETSAAICCVCNVSFTKLLNFYFSCPDYVFQELVIEFIPFATEHDNLVIAYVAMTYAWFMVLMNTNISYFQRFL